MSAATSPAAGASIAALAELVSWDSDSAAATLAGLEEEYALAVAERLGVVLAHLVETDPQTASDLRERLRRLAPEEFDAFLSAPETGRRVVLAHLHELPDTATVMLRRLEAGGEGGDPQLRELARLDNGAPVLLDGRAQEAMRSEIDTEVERVRDLRDLLATHVPVAAQTTGATMRELVLRFEGPDAGFRSNSPQGYVGRAVLNNPAEADDVALLEALVHEPIHGLVGMSEAIGLVRGEDALRWVYDDRLYDGESHTVSPWTGVELDLPTYLHACFVWFGLLRLWAQLYEASPLDPGRVRNRITRALAGFVEDRALAQLRPHEASINPVLVAAVAEMCASVRRFLADQLEGQDGR